ncbi:MAG: ATP-binding protein [Chloroflexota bacterium]
MTTKKPKGKVKTKTLLPKGLPPAQLSHLCDPKRFDFKTTDELPRLQDVIGQPRAFRALEIGSEIPGPGFNIITVGVPASGRTTLTKEYLERKAVSEPVPDDWCYVNNFSSPHEPKVLRLPTGKAKVFREDILTLINRLEQAIPKAFESEEYAEEHKRLTDNLKRTSEKLMEQLHVKAEKYSFLIARTPFGLMLVPAVEGRPLKTEELDKLTEEQRHKLGMLQENLEEELKTTLTILREKETETYAKIDELDKKTAHFIVDHLVDDLVAKYKDLASVTAHLEDIQKDIVENVSQFRRGEEDTAAQKGMPAFEKILVKRYDVNIIVDNSETKGAPVILENHPSYQNLLGRIEHEVIMGASRTDFSLIRGGALHRANGGYLIIPVRDVLMNPYAWEGLKRALRDRCIRIIELGAQLGLMSTATLEPQPIPLDVKIVLIGTPYLYYQLRAYDEDFAKMFKVRAEFTTLMDRTVDTEKEYALFVKAVADDNDLPPFTTSAIARIVEYGSRLAEDKDKLSTRFGKIADLIHESAYWAAKGRTKTVTGKSVTRAIEESIYRNNLIEERIQELIHERIILIDVEGNVTGQVNALSVLMLGDYSFGRPSRVTASVYPGKGGVVDIERQADLSGPIHTKGVLIITGLLGKRYGQKQQLSITASLTFEQSYEEIEGDSASLAELLALLSAISEIPLRQDCAVTGSVNQLGQIQTVGGINEKIEGFFTTCKLKGFTGNQGVIIPEGNVRNLMLKDEVIRAVKEGKFHVWAISTIDQGIRLMTGYEAGELQEDGTYPEDSFNYLVSKRLAEFTETVQAKPETPSEEEDAKDDKSEEKKEEEKNREAVSSGS